MSEKIDKADEIARNISPCPCCTGDYSGVVKALHEYGQAVRARDAEIAREQAAEWDYVSEQAQDAADQFAGSDSAKLLRDCAAAISKEPLE